MARLAIVDAHLAEAQRALRRARRILDDERLHDRELTVSEVADVLECSEDRVRLLLRKGNLPGRRSGRQWRVSGMELVLWLMERARR